MCTHLAKRGSRYYFRRKIPQDILSHYNGKEVIRSLGTSDRRDAERLVRIFDVKLDKEFEQLRRSCSSDSRGLSDTKHADLECSDQLIVPDQIRLKGIGLALQETVVLKEDCTDIVKVRSEYQARSRQRQDVVVINPKTSFNILIDKWALGIQPQQNTISRTRMHMCRFERMGKVHHVEDVTKQHVLMFIEQLREAGQTSQNINMHLSTVIKLLNYAMRLDLIQTNVASGLTVKVIHSEKTRCSFDLSALKKIFGSPVYKLGHRPIGGGGEASYWLPLLAMYTGARLEELCQLHPDNVMQVLYHDEGSEISTWVIHITDAGEGQGLKNAGSRRRIPLHPELERLGFISYLLQAKLQGRKRIFDKLTPSVDGKEGGNFTKWFGRYLRHTCKVEDRRMVFHSFRHLFKEIMRELEVSKEINDALTGHESGDVGDKYGSDVYPLRPLVNAIKQYRVPCLDLPVPWETVSH